MADDLSNVKPGDVLAARTDRGRRWVLGTVERFTPSGLLVLAGGEQVYRDGRSRKQPTTWDTRRQWQPATPEILAVVELQKARERAAGLCRSAKFDTMGLETARRIIAALEGVSRG